MSEDPNNDGPNDTEDSEDPPGEPPENPPGDPFDDYQSGYEAGSVAGANDGREGNARRENFDDINGSEEYKEGYIYGYNEAYNAAGGDYNYGYNVGYDEGSEDATNRKPKRTDFSDVSGTKDYKDGYTDGYNDGYNAANVDYNYGYEQGEYDARYKMQKQMFDDEDSEAYINGYNKGFNLYVSTKCSFISLYSNTGTDSSVGSIIESAINNSFEEISGPISIGENWRLCSILFIMQFENGKILADRYDFLDSVIFRENPVNPISLTVNSFTPVQFTLCLHNEFVFKWSGDSSAFNFTVYNGKVDSNSIYCSFGSQKIYNYIDFNYNIDVKEVQLLSMNVLCKWEKPEGDDVNYFPLSYSPNFLRVQTDHSSIKSIKYTYTEDNGQGKDEYTGIINLTNGIMRQYTYCYGIESWKETKNGDQEEDMASTNEMIRIYSNRDRISFLIDEPGDDNDVFEEDLFTFRCIKRNYGWNWLCLLDDENNCTLTGIWIKFDDSITVMTGGDVDELSSNQFMYGNGNVTTNKRGKVYGNGVTTNCSYVYGNGKVTTNYGFVFGNVDVTSNTNNGLVSGNGNVPTNSGYVFGNGDVATNDGEVYGNGIVPTNSGYVYGNGIVTTNDNGGNVYGNGKIGSNDNIYPPTETINSVVANQDVYGYGNTVNITNGLRRVINGYIYKDSDNDKLSENTAKANTVNGRSDTISNFPVAIINSSVVYISGEEDNKITVEGNTVNGDRNVINGFRIYGKHMIVKGNAITGNYNTINPNYIDENADDITFENAKIIGNHNIINDPNAVVLKGTMNIFN